MQSVVEEVVSDLAGSSGAGLVGYTAVGTGAVATDVQSKLRETVSVFDFMTEAQIADVKAGTASIDVSAAMQAALNTGKAVDLLDCVYLITSTITYTGKVVIYGNGATIKTNVQWLKVTNGSDSVLRGFNVIPATTPYTILRNTTTWSNVAGDVVQSLEGYIPSESDTDIWAGINAAHKTSNSVIAPMIYFTVSSAAGGRNVDISHIGGYQLCVVLEGYTNSSVHDCNFGAGQATYGGIVIFNGVNRAYNSALLGFTLPRGVNNSVVNNKVKYATLNGICWFGNDQYDCSGNTVSLCGESGIKTYQYDGAAGPSETISCVSTSGRISRNKVSGSFYDGIDAQVLYGVPYSYIYVGTLIEANYCANNRHSGISALGASFNVVGNVCNENGTYGISLIGQYNTLAANHARRNATTGTSLVAQPFDIQVQGNDCVSFGNSVNNPSAHATWNYLHSGLGGNAPTSGREGLDFGNYCDEGVGRLFISPNIGSFLKQNDIYIQTSGWYQQNSGPVVVNGATYTVTNSDYQLDFYTIETCTVTLPPAANFKGRILKFRNTNTFSINSASTNVQQITGGAPSTTILTNVSGKWCEMMSNGDTWRIMAAN